MKNILPNILLIIKLPLGLAYFFMFTFVEFKKAKKENPDISNLPQFYIDNFSAFNIAISSGLKKYEYHFFFGGILFWTWLIFMILR